jgi:hypothetical protein
MTTELVFIKGRIVSLPVQTRHLESELITIDETEYITGTFSVEVSSKKLNEKVYIYMNGEYSMVQIMSQVSRLYKVMGINSPHKTLLVEIESGKYRVELEG